LIKRAERFVILFVRRLGSLVVGCIGGTVRRNGAVDRIMR